MGRKLRGKVVIATHNSGKLKEMREELIIRNPNCVGE